MLRAILYLSILSPPSIFFSILLARLNLLYDVIIGLVRLTQIFSYHRSQYEDVFKNCTFLKNQFIKN